MLLSVWQDCKVHAANGIAQCDESFLTCIPLHPVPSPILQNFMHLLHCKRAGSFTEKMQDHCVLKVKDSCCSFQDEPAAGLLLTDLQGRERYIKHRAADPTLLVFPSLSQHRHFHLRPCRAPQVEILSWRLSKPAILQVATFLSQRLSCLFERVEQDLFQLPSLIYQHKSTHVSPLHPSS